MYNVYCVISYTACTQLNTHEIHAKTHNKSGHRLYIFAIYCYIVQPNKICETLEINCNNISSEVHVYMEGVKDVLCY